MKKSQVWLPVLFAIILIIGMMAGYMLRERLPASQSFFQTSKSSAVQEAMDLIRLHYVDPVSVDSITDDAIEAMLSRLDPHSVYIPARYLGEINEGLQGNFEGIGVEFQIIDDTVNVVNVLQGGPSDKAGVKVGDKFLKVGDSSVANRKITSDDIKRFLRGPGGSTVTVTFLRGASRVPITLQRGTIPLYSVDADYMINDTTGFIHLNKFSSTSYEECMQAFEKLKKLGMKKLIFDLRSNGGGILGEAVDIADEFLSGDKLVVYTKGDKVPQTEYHCKRPGEFEQGKLIMLVDEGSASASEILSGAMQDWDRATIIGRRTFGKGLVQEQYDLTGGSALRLTVARYYTPVGRSIQKSYAGGRAAYDDEVLERFHNREVITDSVKTAPGKAYTTPGGHRVFGGGGITPDIFVPYDTASLGASLAPLFTNQVFAKFIYRYYLANQTLFGTYKNAKDFSGRYAVDAGTWKSLTGYLAANKIQLPDLSEPDRLELQRRIKSFLARQIWGVEGYYEVNNNFDLTVRKALAVN